MSVPFDTLQVSKRPVAGGFTTEQAQSAAEAFSDALRADRATKTDVTDVRGDIEKTKLALRAEIENTRVQLKAEIETTKVQLRAEIENTRLHLEAKYHEGKAEIIKWVAGIVTVQTLALLGAVFALLKMLVK